MSYLQNVQYCDGKILTGRKWRMDNEFFKELPFYLKIPTMKDMGGLLHDALVEVREDSCNALLVVSSNAIVSLREGWIPLQRVAKGLDEVYPFSDTTGVDVILRESKLMISAQMTVVGGKNASRIWGFLSKFIMVDRFGKTLGVADVHPCAVLERKICESNHLSSSAFRVSVSTQKF